MIVGIFGPVVMFGSNKVVAVPVMLPIDDGAISKIAMVNGIFKFGAGGGRATVPSETVIELGPGSTFGFDAGIAIELAVAMLGPLRMFGAGGGAKLGINMVGWAAKVGSGGNKAALDVVLK